MEWSGVELHGVDLDYGTGGFVHMSITIGGQCSAQEGRAQVDGDARKPGQEGRKLKK